MIQLHRVTICIASQKYWRNDNYW